MRLQTDRLNLGGQGRERSCQLLITRKDQPMKSPNTLVKAGTLSMLVLIGGCANWGPGVVPPSRANGEATAPNTRLRSSAPVDTNVVLAAKRAPCRSGYDPGSM